MPKFVWPWLLVITYQIDNASELMNIQLILMFCTIVSWTTQHKRKARNLQKFRKQQLSPYLPSVPLEGMKCKHSNVKTANWSTSMNIKISIRIYYFVLEKKIQNTKQIWQLTKLLATTDTSGIFTEHWIPYLSTTTISSIIVLRRQKFCLGWYQWTTQG